MIVANYQKTNLGQKNLKFTQAEKKTRKEL